MEELIIKKSRNGKGLFANKYFSAKDIIFEVKGMFVSGNEEDGLEQNIRDNTFRFDLESYISPQGEIGDFLNHSCQPNSYVLKENDKLLIVSIQDIKRNEEILIDYSTIIGDDDSWIMPNSCNCGKDNCRRIIKKFSLLDDNVKNKYISLNMVPDYIYDK